MMLYELDDIERRALLSDALQRARADLNDGRPLTEMGPYLEQIRTCSIDGCQEPSVTRGWCGKHYTRWQKYGDTDTVFCVRVLDSSQRGRLGPSGLLRSEMLEYTSWSGMRDRCLNPDNKRWERYGGRGIKICPEWLNSFDQFYADMGPRPTGTSIERRNNDGHYEPSNCYWATPKEQQNNTQRNRQIEYQGRTQTVTQWAQELEIGLSTILTRLKRGWCLADALSKDTRRDGWKRGARKRGGIR